MTIRPVAGKVATPSDAALDASSLSDTEYLAKLGYKQELKRDLACSLPLACSTAPLRSPLRCSRRWSSGSVSSARRRFGHG
jgi:hypothetical protein